METSDEENVGAKVKIPLPREPRSSDLNRSMLDVAIFISQNNEDPHVLTISLALPIQVGIELVVFEGEKFLHIRHVQLCRLRVVVTTAGWFECRHALRMIMIHRAPFGLLWSRHNEKND